MAEVLSPIVERFQEFDNKLNDITDEIDSSVNRAGKSEDVVNWTNKVLQGEFTNFKKGDDLKDVLKTLKNQDQISPTNPDLLKYFAQKIPDSETKKSIMKRLKNLKRESVKSLGTDDDKFVGRQQDLDNVLSIFEGSERSNLVNVYGDQGVGKTKFALEVAKNLVADKKHAYTVDLQHAREWVTVLRSLLIAFNSSKVVLDVRKEMIYEIVENLEKQTVLVLDNVSIFYDHAPTELKNEAGELLREMLQRSNNKFDILLISHSLIHLGFGENYRLEAFGSQTSAQLLSKVCPNKETAVEITDICDNKPLLVQTTKAVLNEKLINPEEILEKYDKRYGQALCILEAFKLFSHDMKRVALQLSLLKSAFTVELAAKLIDCNLPETEFYLGILKNRFFLSLDGEKYTMHDLVIEVMTQKGQEENLQDIYKEAEERFFHVFVKRAKEMASLADKDYIKMYLNVQKDKFNFDFAFKLSFERGYLLTSSDYDDIILIAEIVQCLLPSHTRAELFRKISNAALKRGELIPYIQFSCKLASALIEKTATKDEARKVLFSIQNKLQDVSRHQSPTNVNYRLAQSSYEFVKGEITYSDFHNKICGEDDFFDGVECLKKSLETREELIGDHTDTARTLNTLGNCYMDINEHDTALIYYSEAIKMRKRLSGNKEHVDSPTYTNQIACVHEEKGKLFKEQSRRSIFPAKRDLYLKAQDEFRQAASKFQECLEIEKRLHIYGNTGTATYYRNLSNSYSYLEEYDKALHCAKKALRIRKKLLGIDVSTVRSYYQVGVSYEWLCNNEKALKYYYKAYNMESALPPGERSRVKLKIEGRIEFLLGDIEEAREFAKRTDQDALTSGGEDEEEDTTKDDFVYSDDSCSDDDSNDDIKLSKQPMKGDSEQTMTGIHLPNEYLQASAKAFDDTLDTESKEEESETIYECKMIGVEGCRWEVLKSGIVVSIGSYSVPFTFIASSHVYDQCPRPLDPAETLISRVIDLGIMTSDCMIEIPHSGPSHTRGYEIVVKEFIDDTWKDVNVHIRTGLSKQAKDSSGNKCSQSIKFKRRRGGIFCVVSRVICDEISVESSGCVLRSSVFPDFSLAFQEHTVKSVAQASLKIHPVPSRLFMSPAFCCGPVLQVSLDKDIHRPVKVKCLHPLAWHGYKPLGGQLRVLCNKNNDPNSGWDDITDSVIIDVNGIIVTMEIKRFSLVVPIWCKDSKNVVYKNCTNLLSRIFRQSPVSAYFSAGEIETARKNNDSTSNSIVKVCAMPSHKAPDNESNSLEDVYDKENISVHFMDGVRRVNLDKPFTIRFNSSVKKTRSTHVIVEGDIGTCRFESIERSQEVGDVPIERMSKTEKVCPCEFFGISIENKTLQDTDIAKAVSKCFSVLAELEGKPHDELEEILEEALRLNGDRERQAAKYFYQEISHKEYEDHVFDVVVATQGECEGVLHVKELLEKGKQMVEQPIDEDTIKLLSEKACNYCLSIAAALDLTHRYQDIRENFPKQDHFQELMKIWKCCDEEPATLHRLMNALLISGCSAGVRALLQIYESKLAGKSQPSRDVVSTSGSHTNSEYFQLNDVDNGDLTSRTNNSNDEHESSDIHSQSSTDNNGKNMAYLSVLCLSAIAVTIAILRYMRK